MNLRQQAASDLALILEDSDAGFGWPITVTNPDGTVGQLVGFSTDIGLTIDPQTGVAVIGRKASVAIPIARLTTLALGMPRGIPTGRPWVVTFQDIGGTAHTFKIFEAMPDRAAGIVTCLLEAYRIP